MDRGAWWATVHGVAGVGHNLATKEREREFLFVYFWLHWVFMAACGLSLVVASRGYSLVAVCRLLIAVASLVAEHGL